MVKKGGEILENAVFAGVFSFLREKSKKLKKGVDKLVRN